MINLNRYPSDLYTGGQHYLLGITEVIQSWQILTAGRRDCMFWLESAIVARYTRFLCNICWYLSRWRGINTGLSSRQLKMTVTLKKKQKKGGNVFVTYCEHSAVFPLLWKSIIHWISWLFSSSNCKSKKTDLCYIHKKTLNGDAGWFRTVSRLFADG